MDSLETFNQNMQEKVEHWKSELDHIKAQINDADKDSYRFKNLRDLVELQENAYEKLAELQDTSGDSWQDLYEETQREWMELEKKINKAIDALKL